MIPGTLQPNVPPPAPGREGEWARRWTDGSPVLPLAVLFGLNLVDEFDRVAFSVLGPEIRDAFGLSDRQIVSVISVAGIVTLLAALPLGVLADRVKRVPLAAGGAALWGGMTVLTALAPGVAVLLLARAGSGIGKVLNETVHPSLLADFYRRKEYPRVFSVHAAASSLGLGSALIIGLLAAFLPWQVVFLLICIPTALLLPLLLSLREPVRGATAEVPDLDALPGGGAVDVDAIAAASTPSAVSRPLSVRQARSVLFAIPTLRRYYWATPALGLALIGSPLLLSLFFERVHGFGPAGRGLATFLTGAGTVAGLAVGQWWCTRAVGAGDWSRLSRCTTGGVLTTSGSVLLLATSPWAALSVVAVGGMGLGLGIFQTGNRTTIALISPAALRGQAYAWPLVLLAAGAVAAPGIAALAEAAGYRVAFLVLATVLAGAAAILYSTVSLIGPDIDASAGALDEPRPIGPTGPPHGPSATTSARLVIPIQRQDVMLHVENVDFSYDKLQVLFGIDLRVHQGEALALLGTNGAGKSTLLKVIAGLATPQAGRVFLAGEEITRTPAERLTARGLLLVVGGRSVFTDMTIADNLEMQALTARLGRQQMQERLDAVFSTFPRLAERPTQRAGTLSGGEQQQLAIAKALLLDPKVLCIDELSLGLAPVVVAELLDVVRRIHASGVTVVIVEQSLNIAAELCERSVFLEKGEVRFEGATRELLARDDIARAVFLGG